MHRLEGSVERAFKSWCEDNDIICKKMKTSDSRGWPDRMVLIKDYTFYIEFKRAKKSPTAYQEHIHKLLRRLGFKVYVIKTLEKAQEVTLNEIDAAQIRKACSKGNG